MIAIIAYAVASVTGTYNKTGGGRHRPENTNQDIKGRGKKNRSVRRTRKVAR